MPIVTSRKHLMLVAVVALPMLMGAKGEGCDGAALSREPAPNMEGEWAVSYDDRLDIEITIGGATYTEQLGPQGGTVTIDHDGNPFTFNLDCARPEVVCPSEVWPTQVSFRQDNAEFPHRVWLQIPKTECSGSLVAPDPTECGGGTNNPDCEDVCDGEVTTTTQEAFGVINNPGDNFRVALGAGIASNGINCVLLGGSYVDGELSTTGSSEGEDWEAISSNGDVITVYTGGCLWAGDPNMDGQLEALAIGASVRFATGFSAEKL